MLLALAIQTPEVPVQLPIALLSGSLEEKLAKASSLGYDGVELITTEPASISRETVQSLLSKYHLKVSAMRAEAWPSPRS